MRKTVGERWAAVPDLATPRERKWIDEWRGWPGRFVCQRTAKVVKRKADGTFGFMYVLLNRNLASRGELRLGCMPITLEYIKAEVRRCRRDAERERVAETERLTGAYI